MCNSSATVFCKAGRTTKDNIKNDNFVNEMFIVMFIVIETKPV